MSTVAEKLHVERVASVGCVVCRRLYDRYVPAEVHHVAEGSGVRSNFSVAGLCSYAYEGHHDPDRKGTGFHGMGTKKFCSLFRVPGESEYGLLVWVNEDLAKYGHILHEGEVALRDAMVTGLVASRIAAEKE